MMREGGENLNDDSKKKIEWTHRQDEMYPASGCGWAVMEREGLIGNTAGLRFVIPAYGIEQICLHSHSAKWQRENEW